MAPMQIARCILNMGLSVLILGVAGMNSAIMVAGMNSARRVDSVTGRS